MASLNLILALKDLLLAPVDWRCRTSSWPQLTMMPSMSSSIRSLMLTRETDFALFPSVSGYTDVQPANAVIVRARQNGAVLTA